MTRKIVLFDFGGVITTSPFEAFAAYERSAGLPHDSIRRINSTNPDNNAWARFERADVDMERFVDLFNSEGTALGLTVDGTAVLACLSGDIRPAMVKALDTLVEAGCRIGCITNNVSTGRGSAMVAGDSKATQVAEIMQRFEVVIESSKVGFRKPDPRIYQLACSKLGVEPSETIYLDDLGINCKAAHQLGMYAIKVVDPAAALVDLSAATGVALS